MQCVQIGEINIEELINSDKIEFIEPALKDFNRGSIASMKEKLCHEVGFGEIRLVIEWTLFKRSSKRHYCTAFILLIIVVMKIITLVITWTFNG